MAHRALNKMVMNHVGYISVHSSSFKLMADSKDFIAFIQQNTIFHLQLWIIVFMEDGDLELRLLLLTYSQRLDSKKSKPASRFTANVYSQNLV